MTPRALPRRLPLEKQYLIPFELNFRINCTPLITPKREIKQNPSSFLPVGTYLFSERALFKVEPNENLWAKNKPRRRRFYFCAVLNFPDISLRWQKIYVNYILRLFAMIYSGVVLRGGPPLSVVLLRGGGGGLTCRSLPVRCG